MGGESVVVFSLESYAGAILDFKKLFAMHWQENAVYKDIPLNPDYDTYQKIDELGSLAAYTARIGAGQELIAYAVFLIRSSHLHYKEHAWAMNDIIWVHPDHRNLGIGNGLVDCWQADLKRRGIHVVHVNSKVAQPALGHLLKFRGYDNIELGWSKRL